MDDQNKNLIIATVLSFLVILGWMWFFPPEPQAPSGPATEETGQREATGQRGESQAPDPAGDVSTPGEPEATTTETPRLTIDTPALSGSVALEGGRIDELSLKRYHTELDPSSPIVDLLNPVGSDTPYYALFGWAPGGALDYGDVPGADTPWQVEGNDTLTVDTPVTLSWDNGSGLTFRRTLSVDDDYMFTIDQTVENTGDEAVRLAPYGTVARQGELDLAGFFILHEGVVRMSDGELQELDYDDLPDLEQVAREGAPADVIDVQQNGWIGFTDKYWMTTLIPTPGTSFTSVAKYVPSAGIYQTEARLPTMEVAAGETASTQMKLFAGAKEWETILVYQKSGIEGFVDSSTGAGSSS